MTKILCITPNGNIERTWIIPGLELGGAFRAEEAILLPSGKGNNVARALQTLGGQAVCSGFLGGNTGRFVASLIAEAGISASWTWINGETRISLVMYDPNQPNRDATLVSEPGPPVSREDWLRLQKDVLAQAEGGQLACISGSLPRETPLEEFARLIQLLANRGVQVWVDCDGTSLKTAIDSRPAGLKINNLEAARLLGEEIHTVQDAVRAASKLRALSVGAVILTLGASGAVLVSAEGVWFGHARHIPPVSTVGSGDAFMAGWLLGLADGVGPVDALKMAVAAGAANVLTLGACVFDRSDYLTALETARVQPVSIG